MNTENNSSISIKDFSNKSKKSNNSAYLLELRNVTKEYIGNNGKRSTVLNNISLQVHHDEFVSIVGPSRCGKSTLLRIIMGLEKCTRGQII
jgi:ABC-type sugar transport system ATPase subunit